MVRSFNFCKQIEIAISVQNQQNLGYVFAENIKRF